MIYHYLQKAVVPEDSEFSRSLIERLIVDLSIWFPPLLYQSLPILLPFCVRDPSCRSSGPDGSDEWATADAEGYLRDDNSLLKATVPSLEISSPRFSTYNRGRAAKGFVASHVWREVDIDGTPLLASRHPKLYSFVPNVCWLPVQVSKLTDREGGYAQRVLQALSYAIYFDGQSHGSTEILSLWDSLPKPDLQVGTGVEDLNYFQVTDKWLVRRKRTLSTEIADILSTIGGDDDGVKKIKASRYLPSLRASVASGTVTIGEWLRRYSAIAELDGRHCQVNENSVGSPPR